MSATLAACEFRSLCEPEGDELEEMTFRQVARSVRHYFIEMNYSPSGEYGQKPPANWKDRWAEWEWQRQDEKRRDPYNYI